MLTDEKFALYSAYLSGWHNEDVEAESVRPAPTMHQLREFLYESPVRSVEFCYRDATGRLLAVGICDVCEVESLSSVYFYFNPVDSRRSLGTFGALVEIDWSKNQGIGYYYLGYWIEGCATMEYKSAYKPFELLGGDGVWRADVAPAAELRSD